MSSKAKKMAQDIPVPEQKTKNVTYRIDVSLSGGTEKTVYMVVSGVPEDLPDEYMVTVKAAASNQFAQVLKAGGFMEMYNRGKTSADEKPVFYNLNKLEKIAVLSIELVN